MKKLTNVEEKMSQEKTLMLKDSQSGNYIEYTCKLKSDVTDEKIKEFFLSLAEINACALRSDKTPTDFINELNDILYSDVISFCGVLNLIDSDTENKKVIEEPVKNFLNMFDIEERGEYSIKELDCMVRAMNHPNFRDSEDLHKTKRELNSITANTKILNNISFKKKQDKAKIKRK